MTSSGPMIRHMVLIRFPESCPADTVASIFDQFEQLLPVVPGMLNFQFGTDITPVSLSQGFTHGLTIDFKDVASRDGYWAHPGHLAIAEKLVPLLDKGPEDILIFQFPFVAVH